jgi:large subunit ribosomal protein L35
MPKIKTRKTAIKRFKVTASGKIKAFKRGYNHLRTRKDKRQLNRMKGNQVLDPVAQKVAKKSANI